MASSGWWGRATSEQKLAQVQGALEVGMSAGQCAMNVGTMRQNVSDFALRHGLSFSGVGDLEASRHRWATHRARKKFFSGEDVDFWRSA